MTSAFLLTTWSMNPGSWCENPVVVLPPDVRREQVVQRRDRPAPRDRTRRLQPLGVLVEHRVDDVDERLVAVEQPMPPGQQVALQPALAEVLAEHLHDAAVGRQVVVAGHLLGVPGPVRRLEYGAQSVGGRFVGPQQPEVVGIVAHDVAQEGAQHPGRLAEGGGGPGDFHRVITEVGQAQVAQELAAVRVRVGAHAPLPLGRQLGQLEPQPAALVEQLLWLVAAHPALENLDVLGLLLEVGDRHLVGAEGALDLDPVDLLGPGPALGRAEHDHRPARARLQLSAAGRGLDPRDLLQRLVQGPRHQPVHGCWIAAADEQRPVAVALEERPQLGLGDARQHSGIGDLVAVQVQDRQHRAIPRRVKELVGVPAGGQWASLGLTVADHAEDQQAGVVKGRPVSVGERITELAPLVDRARRLGSDMARYAARERELAEELAQPVLVLPDVRIDLAVSALEVGVGHRPGPTVPRAEDVDGIQVARPDLAVGVGVDEVQPGRGPPVPEQPGLDVREPQGLPKQRVVEQVDLAHGQVVGGAPVGVDQLELARAEPRNGLSRHSR
jgi:hypothetical protein